MYRTRRKRHTLLPHRQSLSTAFSTWHKDLNALGNEPCAVVRGDQCDARRQLERFCGSPIEDRAVFVLGDAAHARVVDQDRYRPRGPDVRAGQTQSHAAGGDGSRPLGQRRCRRRCCQKSRANLRATRLVVVH